MGSPGKRRNQATFRTHPRRFHTQPLPRPQVETTGQQPKPHPRPFLFCQLQVVFSGSLKTTLPLPCGTPFGEPRAKEEKPAQLGFSPKRWPKTLFKPMDKPRKKAGRPPMLTGKRTRIIKAKLTDDEFKALLDIQKTSGMNRMELIRKRVLGGGTAVTVNIKELFTMLDAIGAELGRAGNNINQLARHANLLNRQGRLTPEVTTEFNRLLSGYIRIQRELEKTLRQLLRAMK